MNYGNFIFINHLTHCGFVDHCSRDRDRDEVFLERGFVNFVKSNTDHIMFDARKNIYSKL